MPIEVISLISDEESAPTPTKRGIKRPRVSNIPAQLAAPIDDEVMIVSHTKRGAKDLSATANAATTKIEDDVECVGEQRGVDVLADYPHFRFQCSMKSPSRGRGGKIQRYCKRCFCYVCDIPAAQCTKWPTHEHARDTSTRWRAKRMEKLEKRRRAERKSIPNAGASITTYPRTFATQTKERYVGVVSRGRSKRRKTVRGPSRRSAVQH